MENCLASFDFSDICRHVPNSQHILCKGYMKAMLKMHGRTTLNALTTRRHLGYELAICRALREFLQIDKPKVGKIQMRSEDANRIFFGWHGSRQFLFKGFQFLLWWKTEWTSAGNGIRIGGTVVLFSSFGLLLHGVTPWRNRDSFSPKCVVVQQQTWWSSYIRYLKLPPFKWPLLAHNGWRVRVHLLSVVVARTNCNLENGVPSQPGCFFRAGFLIGEVKVVELKRYGGCCD